MKPSSLRALVAATATLSCALAVQALDWPHWRGPDRNGISKESGWKVFPNGDPKIAWSAEVGFGFAGVSVADGKAFTTGNQNNTDTVYAFDAKSGKELWRHSYPHPLDDKYYEGGTSATPTVSGGQVYVLSKRGHLMSLDAATGKPKWSKNIAEELGAKMPTWGFASSVVIDGDRAVVNVGTYGAAVDKNTGKVLWKTGTSESGYSAAVPYTQNGSALYLLFAAKELVAVKADSGEKVWSHPWETSYDVNAADPVLVGSDRIFIASGYNTGGALLDLKGGSPKVVWQNKNIRSHFNPAILSGDHLYAIDGDVGKAQLRCVKVADGSVAWTFRPPNHGAVAMADGKLIVIGEKGELFIGEANPREFVPTARGQVGGGKYWTVPVLANGRVYVRSGSGTVTCVELPTN